MKITAQRRLALAVGLLLLSLLVFATVIQAAQAATPSGTQGRGHTDLQVTRGSVTTVTSPDGTLRRGHLVVEGTSVSSSGLIPRAGTQGRGGANLAPVAAAPAAQPASSGTSSSGTSSATTAWIAAGITAGVVLVALAAWALVRRRRQSGERTSMAYCAQHPEDPMCAAA